MSHASRGPNAQPGASTRSRSRSSVAAPGTLRLPIISSAPDSSRSNTRRGASDRVLSVTSSMARASTRYRNDSGRGSTGPTAIKPPRRARLGFRLLDDRLVALPALVLQYQGLDHDGVRVRVELGQRRVLGHPRAIDVVTLHDDALQVLDL